MNDKRFS